MQGKTRTPTPTEKEPLPLVHSCFPSLAGSCFAQYLKDCAQLPSSVGSCTAASCGNDYNIYPTLHITAIEWEEVMNHNSLP